MALLSFKDIVISGISACVPKNVTRNADFTELIAKESLEKVIKATGIAERRIASSDICASDLCFEAASKLVGSLTNVMALTVCSCWVPERPEC